MSIKIIRTLSIFLLLLSGLPANGQVKVRLFRGYDFEGFIFTVVEGNYELSGIGEKPGILGEGDMVYVNSAAEELYVTTRKGSAFATRVLNARDISGEGIFSIRIISGDRKTIEYEGSLSCSYELETIFLVNEIEPERYIAAVVQAEGGFTGHPEYFKTQAIIARTYTWLHLERHLDDGYNLCDDVHCQAYKGRSIIPVIDQAVSSTTGLVVTGADSLLAFTPFHSNCGGETLPAEKVWLTEQPHLKSITDPYCLYSRNATWRKVISLSTWLKFLGLEEVWNEDTGSLEFVQDTRLDYYKCGGGEYSMNDIRDNFSLRSTFFSVVVEGDSIHLNGRGYGHGVGLCQEGAMVMATRGFSYKQIIGFYYSGINIMDVSSARFPERIVKSF